MARILLIEDDLPMRTVYEAVLVKAGHHISVAANGLALQQNANALDVDLVITDMVMEDVDGIETVLSVRKHYPDLPVLAVSGAWLYLDTAKQLGKTHALLKPFGLSELLHAVDEALAA